MLSIRRENYEAYLHLRFKCVHLLLERLHFLLLLGQCLTLVLEVGVEVPLSLLVHIQLARAAIDRWSDQLKTGHALLLDDSLSTLELLQ